MQRAAAGVARSARRLARARAAHPCASHAMRLHASDASAAAAAPAGAAEPAAPAANGSEWLLRNSAAVLTAPRTLEFLDWPLPATPPHGHVRVALQSVGICGSDVHYFQHGRIGDFVARAPLVLGHEAAGEVVQLGGGVTALRTGTRVAIEPGVPSWRSEQARTGRYNLDPEIVFAATPPHHGALAQYVDHPAEWCHPLPDCMSYEEGAFCEPLSVGVHAARRGGVQPGTRVAVLGAGPIGLVTLMAARAFGADAVVVTDLSLPKLAVATQQGAAATVHVARGDTPEHTAAALRHALRGAPEVVIDCCGFESSMATALLACASGGRVVLVGMGAPEMKLRLTAAAAREVDILGSFRYANTYPLCIQLISSKRVAVSPLITHRFQWSAQGLRDGFDAAVNAERSGAIKVMFSGLADANDEPHA